jgi:hypothetical protein
MDSFTLITKKYDGENAAPPRLHGPVRRLPAVASRNTSDLYYDSHRYRPEDYTIKFAASQHFLILSINVKVITRGQQLGQC